MPIIGIGEAVGQSRQEPKQAQAPRFRIPAVVSTTVGTDTNTAHPRRRVWSEAHVVSAPFSIDP